MSMKRLVVISKIKRTQCEANRLKMPEQSYSNCTLRDRKRGRLACPRGDRSN